MIRASRSRSTRRPERDDDGEGAGALRRPARAWPREVESLATRTRRASRQSSPEATERPPIRVSTRWLSSTSWGSSLSRVAPTSTPFCSRIRARCIQWLVSMSAQVRPSNGSSGPTTSASRLLHVLHRLMRPDPGRLVAFALTLGRLLVPDDTEPLAPAPVIEQRDSTGVGEHGHERRRHRHALSTRTVIVPIAQVDERQQAGDDGHTVIVSGRGRLSGRGRRNSRGPLTPRMTDPRPYLARARRRRTSSPRACSVAGLTSRRRPACMRGFAATVRNLR